MRYSERSWGQTFWGVYPKKDMDVSSMSSRFNIKTLRWCQDHVNTIMDQKGPLHFHNFYVWSIWDKYIISIESILIALGQGCQTQDPREPDLAHGSTLKIAKDQSGGALLAKMELTRAMRGLPSSVSPGLQEAVGAKNGAEEPIFAGRALATTCPPWHK